MKQLKRINSEIIRAGMIPGIILFSIIFDLHAQSEQFKNLPQYLFPDFSASTIKMKAGKDLTLILNYNIVTGKMVFLQKEQVFDMLNPERVDTVFIENRKFIPVSKAFYEVLIERPMSLFIEHKGSIVEPGKPAAYGGTSQVSSSNNISSMQMNSSFYNMKLPGELTIKSDQVFWIIIKNEKHSFINERQFEKIFPGKENEIKSYIKENRLKFENPKDVKKLVQYCCGLTK
jgi:hypothetical protein